jgi:hypothetical protein
VHFSQQLFEEVDAVLEVEDFEEDGEEVFEGGVVFEVAACEVVHVQAVVVAHDVHVELLRDYVVQYFGVGVLVFEVAADGVPDVAGGVGLQVDFIEDGVAEEVVPFYPVVFLVGQHVVEELHEFSGDFDGWFAAEEQAVLHEFFFGLFVAEGEGLVDHPVEGDA